MCRCDGVGCVSMPCAALPWWELAAWQWHLTCGGRFYAGDVYLTTPRWKPGVPSTLNKLGTCPTCTVGLRLAGRSWPRHSPCTVYAANGAPLLQPYPSWDMQCVPFRVCFWVKLAWIDMRA